jgi:uncharacterized membrane protein YGL010W
MSLIDLPHQLSFYGAYHQERRNQLVHLVFVPVIFCSAMAALAFTGPLVHFSAEEAFKGTALDAATSPALLQPFLLWFSSNLILNLAFFTWAFYAIFYLFLSPLVAAPWTIFLFFLYLIGTDITVHHSSNALSIILGMQFLGWSCQILAHQIFEGRKPALMDSFFQSLFLAPLFVWFEVLFIFGFMNSLRKDVLKRISKRIEQDKKAGKFQ